MVGTADIFLNREVSFIWTVHYREVPLFVLYYSLNCIDVGCMHVHQASFVRSHWLSIIANTMKHIDCMSTIIISNGTLLCMYMCHS